MHEIWKAVPNYEGLYEVSNLGNVKSLNYNHTKKPKILAPKHHKNKYLTVSLSKDHSVKNKLIHILVASAFIPNPNNLPCVNHIDGVKQHNNVENLEWVTKAQNTQHAIKNGLRKDSNMRGMKGNLSPLKKPVYQYDKEGNLINEWECISDVARIYKCSPSTIINCCAGRIKSCKGFVWRYTKI